MGGGNFVPIARRCASQSWAVAMDRPSKLIVRFRTKSKIEFGVCGAEVALYISPFLRHGYIDGMLRAPRDAHGRSQGPPGRPRIARTPQAPPGDLGRAQGAPVSHGRNRGRFREKPREKPRETLRETLREKPREIFL